MFLHILYHRPTSYLYNSLLDVLYYLMFYEGIYVTDISLDFYYVES